MGPMDTIRQAILNMNGREFTAMDMPHVNNRSSLLYKLETQGELICIRRIDGVTSTKPLKVYKAANLADLSSYGKTEVKMKDKFEAWKGVYPDFFTLPSMEGRSRLIARW